ncbi:MAG: AMP-binding protein [Acidobacteriota bacterium]
MKQPARSLRDYIDLLQERPDWDYISVRGEFRTRRWTRARVLACAHRFAHHLEASGVAPGDRVLIWGANSPEWAAAFLGCVLRGAVSVPVDEIAPIDLARKITKRSQPRLVVRGRSTAEGDLAVTTLPLDNIEEIVAGQPSNPVARYEPDPKTMLEIVFTSGTTSEPKGVVLNHANLLATLGPIEQGYRRWEKYIRLFAPMYFVSVLPLSHMFGQVLALFIPIFIGGSVTHLGTLRPSIIRDTLRREKAWMLFTVPRFLNILRDSLLRDLDRRGVRDRVEHALERARPEAPLRNLPRFWRIHARMGWRLRGFIVGGAALDPTVESFWNRLGYLIVQGYGLTETAPVISINNPFSGKPGSIGKPLGHQEVKLSEDGEVMVRGPNVFTGYYGDEAATREVFEGEWLKTGDLAEMDKDGHLYYRGRKNDMIVNADGLNIFPSDVETVLNRIAGVKESAVVSAPGALGNEVHAVLLLQNPDTDAKQIVAQANGSLQAFQRIRGFTVWPGDDFPRTGTHKVKKREIVATIQVLMGTGSDAGGSRPAGGSAAAPALSASAERTRRVHEMVAGLAGKKTGEISDQTRLAEDLGLGSLDVVQLTSMLEEEYQIEVDDTMVEEIASVADVERVVRQAPVQEVRVVFPRWSRRSPVRAFRSLTRSGFVFPLLSLWWRLRWSGVENLEGLPLPAIFVANHTSHLDTPAILRALPGRMRGLLAPAMTTEHFQEFFEASAPWHLRFGKGLGYMILTALFNTYPLAKTSGFRAALEYTGELLDAGWCPLVFPEGGLTRSGQIEPFKRGIGLIAASMRVPVVPIRLRGLEQILPPDAHWPRGRYDSSVRIGIPLLPKAGSLFPDEASRPGWQADPAEHSAIAARIEAAIRDL